VLVGATTAFAFRIGTLEGLSKLNIEKADAQDDDFWLQLRSQFDIDPDLTVFNHAGLSPSPIAVRERIAAEWKRANQDPSFHIWRRQDNELTPIREELAKLVGCETEELALVMNATYGLQTGIMGVPLCRGDEILTTTHDYSRAHTAIEQRCRRDGAVKVEVEISTPPEAPEKVANQILEKVTPKTKLVLLSDMTFLTGQIMPIRQVAEALSKMGIPVFNDGAHGLGLLDRPFETSKAQIYCACLHKWMMGPLGTGVFCVKKPWIEAIWPLHPASKELDPMIHKFEQVGTRPAAPLLAIKESLEFHKMVGREKKAARLELLKNRLAERVLNLPGVTHYSSLDPTLSRAMLVVGMEKAPTVLLAGWLLDKHRIHVTTIVRGGVNGIRISPNIFTTRAEVDRLANVLEGVARDGIGT